MVEGFNMMIDPFCGVTKIRCTWGTLVECKYVVPKAINMSSLTGLGAYCILVCYKYVVPSGTGLGVLMSYGSFRAQQSGDPGNSEWFW